MRPVPLFASCEGINLLRTKGGASPNALFDAINCWITTKKTINARPGLVKVANVPGTVGGTAFEGKFHVFAATRIVNADPNVVVDILLHPTGSDAALVKVHRAFPFLGRLYVVGEFADGVVQHYWIEKPATWKALTMYAVGAMVQPTIETGYYYEQTSSDATPAWAGSVAVALADKKVPTVGNGFRYTATATTGAGAPKTSNTEPTWPTVAGGTVVERVYVTETSTPPTPPVVGPGGNVIGGGSGGLSGDGVVYGEYGPFPRSTQ